MTYCFRMIFVIFCFTAGLGYGSQVALVTGASRGIGYATAELLAKEGYCVYAGVRKSSSLELLKSSQERFPNLQIIFLDVTDQNSIDEAVHTIYSKERHLDILVNNAGVEMIGSVENTTIEEAQQLFDVNFFGVMRVTQAVLPIMRNQHSGHIIQISSRSGFRPLPSLSLYAATEPRPWINPGGSDEA